MASVTHLAAVELLVVGLVLAVSGFEGWLALYLLGRHRRLLLRLDALESTRAERGIIASAAIADPRSGAVVTARRPPPRVRRIGTLTPPDAAWEAIVEQLLATASDGKPHEAPPHTEYAGARKLGMHINRPPSHRRHGSSAR